MHKRAITAAAFLLAALTLALCLSSCGNLRSDLFAFNDESNRPRLGFYPDPAEGPFTRPTRVIISTSARFSDWQIRYTTDPAVTLEQPELWKVYDPEKNIILGASAGLRAVAFQPAAEGVSDIAQADYVFDLPNIQVYVNPSAPEGGDGTTPETPFNTLQEGIDLAASLYVASGPLVVVCAYQGEYHENPVMKGGVLVRGSYQDDWRPPEFLGVNNQDLYLPSQLEGVADNEVYAASEEEIIPLHALRFPAGLAAPSGVEYFQIRAPSGGVHSAAVLAESGQTSLFRCRIEGGNGSGVASGIWARRGGVVVDRCFVKGRRVAFPGDSVGVHSLSSIMDIRESRVESGNGYWDAAYSQRTAGIRAVSASGAADLRVSRCEVFAQGGVGTSLSRGIDVYGANAVIEGNTVLAGSVDSTSTGVYLFNAGDVRISESNIFAGYGTTCAGLLIEQNIARTARILIERNRIWGGDGGPAASYRTGLQIYSMVLNAPLIIRNNIIHGGIGTGSGTLCNGVSIDAITGPENLYLLANTIWAGGSDSNGDIEYGLYMMTSSSPNIDIINNIVDSRKWPVYITDAGGVRSFWHNSVFSNDAVFFYVISVGGVAEHLYANLDTSSAWISPGIAYSNVTSGTNPRVYMSWPAFSSYPTNRDDFRTYDFGLEPSPSLEADTIIGYGYNGSTGHAIPSGVIEGDGEDLIGRPRTIPWTPGAIERE